MTELRLLPKVDELAGIPELERFAPTVRVQAARAAVEALRQEIKAGSKTPVASAEQLAVHLAVAMAQPSMRPAINLSGVILHTGLGRARLADTVAAHVAAVAAAHSPVELDLGSGRRGDRQGHVREMLKQLTGAEDAFVVNNAAAGVVLTLTALCNGSEVVLSRGQMVEIGGTFRMPDIVRQSGCELIEVGCTNKTRLSDFREVVHERTGAVLRCHPSNFKIIGFTEEPSLEDLAALCRETGTLLIDDQGSGSLVDLAKFGLPSHPTLPGSIAGGSSVAIASGDKLLGGPQAGIIVGREDLIAQINRHPLARCVRIDKLTLAALEATLKLYVEGRESEIPTLRYLGRSEAETRRMAQALSRAYAGSSRVEKAITEVGGGSAPGSGVPTFRVGLESTDPEELAVRLRQSDPPIVGRIEGGRVWLDPRTLEPSELKTVALILRTL